jgi:nucleotide-binding universal stress UspA family protein
VDTRTSLAVHVDGQQTTRRIAVGMDDRGRSISALVWAVEEAERENDALTVVRALPDSQPATAIAPKHALGTLARRLTMRDFEQCVRVGDPVEVLLGATSDADLLVVGCRTMRPARRMLVGSTSHSVARWSPVPVVVVPEAWMQPSMATAPIVAGVRLAERGHGDSQDGSHEEVLGFSFTRAAVLRVPLIVVSALEVTNFHGWSPADVKRVRSEHQEQLEEMLAPWRERHPEVEVVARAVWEPPEHAILEASTIGQLAVVGRSSSSALTGLLGGTARGVLHRSSRPVAVIPCGQQGHTDQRADDELHLGAAAVGGDAVGTRVASWSNRAP